MMRNKRGFTLVELLVVLAVLALILAISVPSFTNLSISMKKKQLDDTAADLFLLAQNHLAYVKSARSKAILCEADFTDEVNGQAHFYFSNGSGSCLLPENALPAGNVLVIVDIRTLSVTDIFYSERLSIDELKDFAAGTDDVRINQYIGYYSGVADVLATREEWLIPTLVVNDGDELTIDFYCNINNRPEGAEYFAKVTLLNENGTYIHKIHDLIFENDDPLGSRGRVRGSILIDKVIADGASHYMQMIAPEMGVSDSITASVRIYQKVGDKVDVTAELTAQENAVAFSPLFAEKSGTEVKIANARHLNNLRFLEDSCEAHVTQTADIAFSSELLPNGFVPIPTFSGTFDGGDKLIINPKIKADGERIGIFGEISGYIKNMHIVGNGETAICGEIVGSANVGILCAVAESGSTIENCSVSDLSLEVAAGDGSDIHIGGLVGESRGRITRSSSVCDISVSGGESAKIGGLVGELCGGTVEFSHSAGKLSLDGNSVNSCVSGISGEEGVVSHCYSECSAGYISGAEYYGIAPHETDFIDCYFVAENAWLADDLNCAVNYDELKTLDIEGFTPADDRCPLPESVTVNGVPTSFGEPHLADPRGLVGIVKVTYDGGGYVNEVFACFDAYGNISTRSPDIYWSSPQDGSARYYLYRSTGVHPEKGEPMGWDCAFDGAVELGEEHVCGRFIYQQILLSDSEVSAELSFGNVSKTVMLSGGQEEAKLGKIGVAAAVNHIDFEYIDDIEVTSEIFEYYYYFYDFATECGDLVFDEGYGDGGILGKEGITFTRETENDSDYFDDAALDDEVKIYVFADADSEMLFKSQFLLNDMLGEPEEVDGIFYREWLGEWRFEEDFTVEVDLGGRSLTLTIYIFMDWSDWRINVNMKNGAVA